MTFGDHYWTGDSVKSILGGGHRGISVSIGITGVTLFSLADEILNTLGGTLVMDNDTQIRIEESSIGLIKIELSAPSRPAYDQYLNNGVMSFLDESPKKTVPEFKSRFKLETKELAETFSVWRVSFSPVLVHQLQLINELLTRFRELGALGARDATEEGCEAYISVEMPDDNSLTIENYVKAFLCLRQWLLVKERADFDEVNTKNTSIAFSACCERTIRNS